MPRLLKGVPQKLRFRSAGNIIGRRDQSHRQISSGDFRLPGHAHQDIVGDGLHFALPDGKRIVRNHCLGLVRNRGHADQRTTRYVDVFLAHLRIHRKRGAHLHARTWFRVDCIRIVHGVRDIACRIHGTRAGHRQFPLVPGNDLIPVHGKAYAASRAGLVQLIGIGADVRRTARKVRAALARHIHKTNNVIQILILRHRFIQLHLFKRLFNRTHARIYLQAVRLNRGPGNTCLYGILDQVQHHASVSVKIILT